MTAQLLLWLAISAPPPEGLLAGRLAIYEGRALAPLRHVEAVLRTPVGLSLRRGRHVYDAQLDDEGFFVLRVPAGTYRLEAVALGLRAEVVPAHDVDVRPAELVCAGTWALSIQRLEYLGQGTLSRFAVLDDCARMLPFLRQRAGWPGPGRIHLPRPAPPEEVPRVLTAADLLCGLRAEASTNASELVLRGWYVYPLEGKLGAPGAITLHVSFGRVTGEDPGFGAEFSVGPGVNVLGVMELAAVAGMRAGFDGFPTEPMGAVIVRPGSYGAGFDFRVQWTTRAGPTVFVGVDLAPFFLVGAAL
jgi:hypothetical protein